MKSEYSENIVKSDREIATEVILNEYQKCYPMAKGFKEKILKKLERYTTDDLLRVADAAQRFGFEALFAAV